MFWGFATTYCKICNQDLQSFAHVFAFIKPNFAKFLDVNKLLQSEIAMSNATLQ